ncbi:probable nucleoredoxin 1-1 [Musa acuminata AAA Group]|uniref:probable nucleoredoxin 1-1 n=1 Tax=Musa acuminata AAA Group TaxID=214697 RepID=UPI0031D8BD81
MAAEKWHYNVVSLLSGTKRDFLIRNNGEKVAISSLDGKKFGLFLSDIYYERIVTDDLIKVYNQLSSEGRDFEIVFVSCDSCEETFNRYFSDMPWLAVPFADSDTRERLHDHFGSFEEYYPAQLIIYDAAIGMVVNEEGLRAVAKYGVNGYPFTVKRFYELEAAAKKERSLRSLLVSPSRDYLISNDGSKVAVSDLEGKIVAFYFWYNIPDKYGGPNKLTLVLAEIYRKLKEAGESFEVVLVPLDDDKSSYEQGLASMPWLAIPFEDEGCEKLVRYFELWPFQLPTVLVIGADGKIMLKNYDRLISKYGVLAWEAFPFSKEQLDLLPEKAKAAQTLESLLVAGDLDYVIGKEGLKVPVKELVGKTILLFFSIRRSGTCRGFLTHLIEEYHKIKHMDSAFEVVNISMDKDQDSFEEFFSGMPWLSLPFGDERKKSLKRTFQADIIYPSLVAIGPTGRTSTRNAMHSLATHGADAYPFSEERIKELDQKIDEMAKGWPEKRKHEQHKHGKLEWSCLHGLYMCRDCHKIGSGWCYLCSTCGFGLHPKCALKEEKKEEEEHDEGSECDGEVYNDFEDSEDSEDSEDFEDSEDSE